MNPARLPFRHFGVGYHHQPNGTEKPVLLPGYSSIGSGARVPAHERAGMRKETIRSLLLSRWLLLTIALGLVAIVSEFLAEARGGLLHQFVGVTRAAAGERFELLVRHLVV